MDGDAGLGQGISSLVLVQPGLADFHARGLRHTKPFVSSLNSIIQVRQTGQHIRSGPIARVSRRMTLHANGLRPGGELLVRRMTDTMIAMTNHASGKTRRLERYFVAALLEHLILEDVALGTNVLHGIDAGRRGTMVSMAGSASWRAEIAADGQRIVM